MSGPRSGGATRSWRASAPTRRGGPSPRLEVFDDDTGEATPAPILQRPILDSRRRGVAGAGRHDRAGRRQLARPLAPHRPRLRRRPARRRPRRSPKSSSPRWRSTPRRGSGSSPPTTWPVTSSGSSTRRSTAAKADDRFVRNVDALRDVQPAPLTAAEITPEFGVTWLEPDDIAAFIADHDGGDVTVKYHPPTGIWSYDGWAYRRAGPVPHRAGTGWPNRSCGPATPSRSPSTPRSTSAAATSPSSTPKPPPPSSCAGTT